MTWNCDLTFARSNALPGKLVLELHHYECTVREGVCGTVSSWPGLPRMCAAAVPPPLLAKYGMLHVVRPVCGRDGGQDMVVCM